MSSTTRATSRLPLVTLRTFRVDNTDSPPGEGLSNREIAERVGLEVKTVKNYVSALLAKLRLANRTQAASSPPRCALAI
jgi:transposase